MIRKRINPGTTWSKFYPNHDNHNDKENNNNDNQLIQFNDMDSPFMYQDYIQEIIRIYPHEPQRLMSVPNYADPLVWQYEHLRIFCLQLTIFVIELQPYCSYITCSFMKANEWQYLCAAHSTPQNCCAFDYIIHTLDNACSLLNNPKIFPSRISMPPNSTQQFSNIARRLYRIFAHTYFHHLDAFQQAEADTGLYARFLTFITQFDLMGKDTILIPS